MRANSTSATIRSRRPFSLVRSDWVLCSRTAPHATHTHTHTNRIVQFVAWLSDGVLLCRLALLLDEFSVPEFHAAPNLQFKRVQNLEHFAAAAKDYGALAIALSVGRRASLLHLACASSVLLSIVFARARAHARSLASLPACCDCASTVVCAFASFRRSDAQVAATAQFFRTHRRRAAYRQVSRRARPVGAREGRAAAADHAGKRFFLLFFGHRPRTQTVCHFALL